MGLGTHWEREKNAALLELDRKNKCLESRLQEESNKDTSSVSSQMEKMQQSILQAVKDALEEESLKRNAVASLMKDAAADDQEAPSMWEMQKNVAILELEQRNQQLVNMLKTKDRRAAENEQEKELLEEGFVRGQECMRLYTQVRALQSSVVLQAQRIWDSKHLTAVFSGWQRLVKKSMKTKVLRKAQSLWDLRIQRKSFASLAANRVESLATKKLNSIAMKHRNKFVMMHLFQTWRLLIRKRSIFRERLVVFKVFQSSRSARVTFTAWKFYSETLMVKALLQRKAESVFVKHSVRRSWFKWKNAVLSSRIFFIQAAEFSKHRRMTSSFQTWFINAQENLWENAHQNRIEQHRRTEQLQKFYRAWRWYTQGEVIMQRRFDKLVSTRTRRIFLFTFIGWKQLVRNKKEVRIWRSMSLAKQKLQLSRSAFQCWKSLWTQRRHLLHLYSRWSEKRRLYAFKAWVSGIQRQKFCQQHVRVLQKRAQQRQLKEMFHKWLMFMSECRQSSLLKDARILRAQLELSRQDLQTAGSAQAEMTKLIRRLETEKAMVIRDMNALAFRTPAWTSGFLDAELRWSSPHSPRGCVPSPRVGHTIVALQLSSSRVSPSHLVVYGGYDGLSVFNDFLVFHTADTTWKAPKLTVRDGSKFPRSLQHHTACSLQDRVVYFGGFDGTKDYSELSVLQFSKDGSSCDWSQPETRLGILPGPMSQHTSCLNKENNQMIVFGGYRSNVGHLNELWILDLQWMDWHLPEFYGDPPAARRGHGAVIIGGVMYVFGGYDGRNNLGDLQTLNLKTMHWSRVQPLGEAPTARRHHSMEVVGRHFVVYGGYDGESYLEDVYSFDTETCIWKRWGIMKPEESPAGAKVYGRSMHAMVCTGQRFVIVGGIHEHGPLGDVLHLENGAAVDGLELQRLLCEERSRVQSLQGKLLQNESSLRKKMGELASAYAKVAECQMALKVETNERKTAVSEERILLQKLRKVRKRISLW